MLHSSLVVNVQKRTWLSQAVLAGTKCSSKQFVWLSTLPDDTCWGSDSEARPADETANCRWRRAPVFARAKGPQQKPAKRKRMPQTLRNAEVPSAAARSCKTLKVEGISHLSRQIEEENNSQRA